MKVLKNDQNLLNKALDPTLQNIQVDLQVIELHCAMY